MTRTAVHDSPLVSVITIFFNAGNFFREAVDSVRGQTYPHWELLLVDDGSTDGTSRLAQDYAARDPERIRYVTHERHENRGMSASRNLGFARSRGAFVGFLDADDVWLADKLETQMTLMAAQPAAAVVSGPTELWHSWTGRAEDAKRDAIRPVTEPADTLYRPPELLRRYLQDEALTPATCSVLIRREAFERTGGFEERFRGLYEDQAFFLKAYLRLPIYLTSTCTDRYRQHPGSHSAEALQAGRYFVGKPGPALVDLLFWLTRYLARQRTTDRIIWTRLQHKLLRIGLHRTVTTLNRPAKGAIALAWATVNRPAKRVITWWWMWKNHRERTRAR